MQDTNKDHVEHQSPVASVEQTEASAPLPSFNVFRFRKIADDTQEFYDPVTDIMNILPVAIQSTMETLDGILSGSEEYEQACAMAGNIHQLFQIRLVEQKDRVDDVLSEFMEYFKTAPQWVRTMFTETLFINLMAMWGISQRRVSNNRSKPLTIPPESIRLSSLLSYVRPETKEKVLTDLMSSHREAIHEIHESASNDTVYFTDEHGNLILEDAKKFVASIVPIKDGPKSWESISNALEAMEAANGQIAAAKETYPGYSNA